jgi:hypothetical protein
VRLEVSETRVEFSGWFTVMVRAFSPQRVWGDETWGCHPRLGSCWACGPGAPTVVMDPVGILD